MQHSPSVQCSETACCNLQLCHLLVMLLLACTDATVSYTDAVVDATMQACQLEGSGLHILSSLYI